MVIVPVAFIAGAPKGAGDQPTGQNTTFLFSANATSELGTYTDIIDNTYYVKCDGNAAPIAPGNQDNHFHGNASTGNKLEGRVFPASLRLPRAGVFLPLSDDKSFDAEHH
ncbi:hypothetical protein [Burkholderia latens]|uniref:hypothetical protein n=1 Tax=Burkholderia latens TaxID=488446 RepID=UPI001AE54900|nr:hypothetical protein [Burkholderia latens]MBR7964577.1 hypothetical protein [Burkholderia vietnamiensis]QTO46933.1 hypothetical protein J8I85_25925 [Burkholderia latens]